MILKESFLLKSGFNMSVILFFFHLYFMTKIPLNAACGIL